MSLKAGVNVEELLARIEVELCPVCKKKLAAITVPISQTLTVAELLAQVVKKK